MDPTTRLKRHEQHGNAGTMSIRQVALSGVIFAAVILFNVIEPYTKNEEFEPRRKQLEQEERRAAQKLAQTEAFLTALDEAKKITLDAPWNEHNIELQRRFKLKLINDPEEEADNTVRKIAEQIRKQVVEPLKAAVNDNGLTGDVAAYPKSISDAIDKWEKDRIGVVWYQDVGSKNSNVKALGDVVTTHEDEAIAKVEQAHKSVTKSRDAIEKEHSQLLEDFTQVKEEIAQALAAALPDWAQRLVHVKTMVWLYPWILIGLTLYLVGRALTASHHYREMANEEGWSAVERSDPILSSIWTLTWRGTLGTSVTLGCYSALLLCLWYFLGKSLELAPSSYTPLWLPHSLMALAMIAVLFTPFRRGHRESE